MSNKPGFDWTSKRAQASRRLKSILRLARFRKERGLDIDAEAFARAIARTLIEAPEGPHNLGRRFVPLHWFGLSLESLEIKLKVAGIEVLDREWLAGLVHELEIRLIADHGFTALTAAEMGAMVDLTSAEREVLKLERLEAVDETREQRLERQAEIKRAKRAAEERARYAASGRHQTRAGYRAAMAAKAAETARLVEASGVSRATHYRNKKKAAMTDV